MRRIGNIVEQRRAMAAAYRDRLALYPEVSYPQDVCCAPWQFFPVLLPSRIAAERFIETAAAAGVEIRRYYRPSLSHWPGTQSFDACPVAEDLADRMCVLPVRSAADRREADEIVDLAIDALDRTLSAR
jgi:dTDP-4-amino-4,6-dideoxygalactose transaminase